MIAAEKHIIGGFLAEGGGDGKAAARRFGRVVNHRWRFFREADRGERHEGTGGVAALAL
jgi:hypothetical protein